MAVAHDGRAAGADEEVEIAAGVGLRDVIDVEAVPATFGDGGRHPPLGESTVDAGRGLRQVQTGRVQNYALGIAIGLIVMAGSYLLLARG